MGATNHQKTAPLLGRLFNSFFSSVSFVRAGSRGLNSQGEWSVALKLLTLDGREAFLGGMSQRNTTLYVSSGAKLQVSGAWRVSDPCRCNNLASLVKS